jgi:hypothetical protein
MGPSLWSSDQSSWLRIQRSGFDSRRYQIWEVVGLERGPLSLVSTIEELFERKNSCSSLGNREYGRRKPSRWSCGILYLQKLSLTSPTSGGLSVDIVRSRTEAMEFGCLFVCSNHGPCFSQRIWRGLPVNCCYMSYYFLTVSNILLLTRLV